MLWLYLITVNTQGEAGVHSTEFSEETVITEFLPILVVFLARLLRLAVCSGGVSSAVSPCSAAVLAVEESGSADTLPDSDMSEDC